MANYTWLVPPTLVTGNAVTAAVWNADFGNMADTGWVALTGWVNSWVSNGGPASGHTLAAYRATGNIVRLGGAMTGGVSGNTAFVIPTNYRPLTQVEVGTATFGSPYGAVLLLVGTDGHVAPFYSAGAGITLDGVTWTTD